MFCECKVYDGSENCGKKYITVTRMISFEYFRYFHFDKSGKGGVHVFYFLLYAHLRFSHVLVHGGFLFIE